VFIQKIEIENFLSYNTRQTFSAKPGLNIIIGRNNVGKSNLFQILNYLTKPNFKDQISYHRHPESLPNGSIMFKFAPHEYEQILKEVTQKYIKNSGYEENLEKKNLFRALFSSSFSVNFGYFREDLEDFYSNSIFFPNTVLFDNGMVIEQIDNKMLNKLKQNISFRPLLTDLETKFSKKFQEITDKEPLQAITKLITAENNSSIKHLSNIISSKIEELCNNIQFFNEIRKRPEPIYFDHDEDEEDEDKEDEDDDNNNQDKNDFSPDGRTIPGILLTLRNSTLLQERKKEKDILTAFSQLFPSYELLVCDGPELRVIDKNSSDLINTNEPFSLSLKDLGMGMVAIVNFLVNIYAKKNYIFIVEEPELHLHPNNQRILYNILKQNSKHNQFFIITHSQTFLNRENIYQNYLIRMINSESTIIQPSENKDMISKYYRFFCYEQPENGEMFFADAVLLVEGGTEKFILPYIANHIGKSLFKRNIFLAMVRGKNNLVAIYQLLQQYQIPTLIVKDADQDSDIMFKKNGIPKEDYVLLTPDIEGVLKTKFGLYYKEARDKEAQSKQFIKKPTVARNVVEKIFKEMSGGANLTFPSELTDIINKIWQKTKEL
jgi:predicted ATP-dependent endonuclease of OLD family